MLRLTNLNPMAHLTCAGHTRLELADILVSFRKAGIENLMALAGDPPEDPSADDGELAHALELVDLARAIGGFCIGVAAHPAGHPRSRSLTSDRRFLARKLKAADFAVTQFFFEPDSYFSLVDDLTARGLTKPVLPGIMPVTSLSSIPRRAQMGCAVPAWLVERLEAAGARGALKTWPRQGSTLPPSYAFSCWTREHRACTSILSTVRGDSPDPRQPGPCPGSPHLEPFRFRQFLTSGGRFRRFHVIFRQESTEAPLPRASGIAGIPHNRGRREALPGDPDGIGVVIHEKVAPAQSRRGHAGGAAPAEEIGDQVTGVTGRPDDPLQQLERLLGGVAGPLGARRRHDGHPPGVGRELAARRLLGPTRPGAMYGMRSMSSVLKVHLPLLEYHRMLSCLRGQRSRARPP